MSPASAHGRAQRPNPPTSHCLVCSKQAPNCLPVALLFLGLAALVFAVAPRSTTTVAYGLVTVAFLWQLVGGLLGAPRFLLDLSPFQHFAYVPAQAFRAGPAAAIVAIAAVASIASLWAFRRRDLTGP